MKNQPRPLRRRLFSLLLLVNLAASLLLSAAGCARPAGEQVLLSSVTDFNDDAYTIGVPQGAAAMTAAEKAFPQATIEYYQTNHDGYMAVQTGKIDAFAYDRVMMTFASANLDGVELIDEPIASTDIVIGISMTRPDLVEPINAFIRQIKADGTFDDMYDRWIVKASGTMPDIPAPTNPTATLRVGTAGTVEPMSYYDAQFQLTGFDIELIKRLALYLNVDMPLTALDFGPLLAAVDAGKIDVVASNLNSLPERRDKMLMSEPYIVSTTVLMVKQGSFSLIGPDSAANGPILTIADLAGKKVGVMTGTMLDQILAKNSPTAVPVQYLNYHDQVVAIQAGKIDAMILDTPMAILFAANNDSLMLVPEKMQNDNYAMAVRLDNTELRAKIDAAIQTFKQDGTLDAMAAKWLEGPTAAKILPDISLTGTNGTLRFGTNSQSEPFGYANADGDIIGYDIELAMRIADKLGMNLQVVDVDFGALIPSLQAGKVDLIGACITVTEERGKMVGFTESYYAGGISALVARPKQAPPPQPGVLRLYNSLSASFTRTFITENRYRLILEGLGVTLVISVSAVILGTLLGFLICFLRISRSAWARRPAKFYIKAIQGTPIVVLLMILYYVIFGQVNISAILVAILGFAVNLAAYASEMIRISIEAVDKGQLEAASALGFKKLQIFFKITFPQAARHFLPVFKGEVVSLIKMTSVVGYLAIQDLTKMSDIIRSRTYEAFFPLIATALIYFLVASALTSLLTRIEIRIDPKRRKRSLKGVPTP